MNNRQAQPKEVTRRVLNKVISSREPRGLFFARYGRDYIGVDNATGDAWTEMFHTRGACLRWLNGGDLE